MIFELKFKPQAIKDLSSLPKSVANRILEKIEGLPTDLSGDVKRLTDFSPEYRLRVGDYRVLFEVEADHVIIYRVKNRSDAYGA